jgi:hypothetical protein
MHKVEVVARIVVLTLLTKESHCTACLVVMFRDWVALLWARKMDKSLKLNVLLSCFHRHVLW